MKNFLKISILLFICFACRKNTKKPENLISEEKLIKILYDQSIIKQMRNSFIPELEEYNLIPSKYLYEKHEIDSISYTNSIKYYSSSPEKILKIYSSVFDKIIEELDHLKQQDSILKAKN